MEFKKFEEETQQKTYQQPIGFSPQTSVSQSGAIGQQYQQSLQARSFYENSLKTRENIYADNQKIKEQNYLDNDYFKTIDALSGLSQTANNIIQDKVKKYTQAKEQEGYIEEINRIMNEGFTDDELREMDQEQALETLNKRGFNDAQLDAFRVTGNPELARIIGMKNKYAQTGAARAYANGIALNDPSGLENALRQARANNNGDPLSESQIRQAQAAYNGSNWLTSGLSGFKPTFLGQEYWTKFAQNQQKVVSQAVLTNRIDAGVPVREEAQFNFGATAINKELDINVARDSYFAATTTTLDARGNPYSNTKSWDDLAIYLGNNPNISKEQLEDIFDRMIDPATGQKARLTKAKYFNKAMGIKQGLIESQRKIQKQERQDTANELARGLMAEANGMEFATPLAQAAWLEKEARARGFYSNPDTQGASWSELTNELSRLKSPTANKAALQYFDNQKVITEAELAANQDLTEKQKAQFRADPRYENYAETKAQAEADKTAEQTLTSAIKGVSSNYVATAPNGKFTVQGGEAVRMLQILQKDYQFELGLLKADEANKGKDIAQLSNEAAVNAIEKAKEKYGLGLTLQQAEEQGIANPIMASGRDKALSMDELNQPTLVEKVNAMKLNDPKTYMTIGGKDDTAYRNNLERRTNDWLDGSPAFDISPLEAEAIRKFGVPFSDLINMSRLQAGLPTIPYSRWEAGLKKLKEEGEKDPQKAALLKALLNPNGSVSAKQRALNLMNPTPPATPPAEVRTAQAQGERDAAGNTFSGNAVAFTYNQTPQQQANVKRMLPSIETASQKTGVPSALIAAHIGTESSFMPRSGPNTRYGRGEGPMQIMRYWHPNMPEDEAGQIEYGANYMNELRYKTEDVHPSAPPVGSYSRGLFLYSGDHNRPYSASDREYVEGTLNEAYSFGMNELLSSTEMIRPSIQRLFA